MIDTLVFLVAGAVVLAGAIGVVVFANPVHSALSLVATLFGVAVLFVAQDAHFLAAVQVIVYAGAIVVLFLFVIMLLGVDRSENLDTEPLAGQRPLAAIAGLGVLGVGFVTLILTNNEFDTVIVGRPGDSGLDARGYENVRKLGVSLFTDYLYAFEITSVLLVIAVVAAVVLARKPPRSLLGDEDQDEEVTA